ncbi:hypothetical protein EDD86DRAFT_250367 [Gorgonomyces haynaldii]|nr:hypothetical protein EDD86DRAFT_250367 [Gorgonomyces haynaldii]
MSLVSLPLELLLVICDEMNNKDYCRLFSINKQFHAMRNKRQWRVNERNRFNFLRNAPLCVLDKYNGLQEMDQQMDKARLAVRRLLYYVQTALLYSHALNGIRIDKITLLHLAVMSGNLNVCKMLVDAGAGLDSTVVLYESS